MELRADDVTWRRVEDDVIVLDLRSSEYLRLNYTGALLWESLVAGATAEQMAATLVQEAGAPAEAAVRDTAAFLTQLRARDLIT